MKKILATLVLLMPSLAFADTLTTVPFVDVNKYAGVWYQIAANPMPFEEGCVCSRQVISQREEGTIGVYNSCNFQAVTGPLREITGTAVNDDPATNARFTVDFGLPDTGQYWIIGLDQDYRYAVVSEPSKTALFILSREPVLAPELFSEALGVASTQVDTSSLRMMDQTDCSYPAEEVPEQPVEEHAPPADPETGKG